MMAQLVEVAKLDASGSFGSKNGIEVAKAVAPAIKANALLTEVRSPFTSFSAVHCFP